MSLSDNQESQVICVDLDGTLIRSDLLFESFVRLLKQSPARVSVLPFHLLRGRAALKRYLAEHAEILPERLPYNQELLAYLQNERERGKKIVLVTASDQKFAEQVAEHLGIFDQVLASDGLRNLKGSKKAELLVESFGRQAFDYAGNHSSDWHVWRESNAAIVVSPRKKFIEATQRDFHVKKSFLLAVRQGVLWRTLRVHQWVKNLLIFLPLIMAHQIDNGEALLSSVIGYFAFCFAASAVYILNDILDLDADRIHARKRYRPLPAGEMPLAAGFSLIPILLMTSLVIALQLSDGFLLILGMYLILTTIYSFWLKRLTVIDIILLAGLYTIRILAGGEAAGVPVSQWLLGFSMFFFLSLACVKRYSELLGSKKKNVVAIDGRGYRVADLELLSSFGSASGYISVMVLALYINSNDVQVLYHTPNLLWLICPLLLFWISRVWLLAHRDEMHDDPIVFAIRDGVSYVVGFIAFLILFFAT